MLRDASFNSFAGVYIVCGMIVLRYGIDSLAAIIKRKYKMNLFVPNTLFLFCGGSSSKISFSIDPIIIDVTGNNIIITTNGCFEYFAKDKASAILPLFYLLVLLEYHLLYPT